MKILIPLDGSDFSEDILGPAKKLASEGGADVEVHLVYVLDPGNAHTTWMRKPPATAEVSDVWSPFGSMHSAANLGQRVAVESKDQASDRRHDEAMDYLNHVAASRFDGTAKTEVLFGNDVAQAIARYAKAEKVDFIAMATHGRTGLAKVLLGSVAASLLRANVAPLYLVRPDNLGEDSAEGKAQTKSHPA